MMYHSPNPCQYLNNSAHKKPKPCTHSQTTNKLTMILPIFTRSIFPHGKFICLSLVLGLPSAQPHTEVDYVLKLIFTDGVSCV